MPSIRSRRSLALLLPFAGVVLAATASAVPIAARTGVSTISPCPSFCGGAGTVSTSSGDGGAGVSSASTDHTSSNGTGRASASLDGPTLLPVLRAESFSNPNARVSSNAAGMQGYDYAGGGNLDLSVTLSGVASAGAPLDASVVAHVVVVSGPDVDFTSDYGTFRFELVELTPGLTVLDELTLSLPVNAGPTSVSGLLSVPAAAGDRIFVWANLVAIGTRGGSADAYDTLTLAFDDPTGVSPIPEPASALLLGIGLALLRRGGRSA